VFPILTASSLSICIPSLVPSISAQRRGRDGITFPFLSGRFSLPTHLFSGSQASSVFAPLGLPSNQPTLNPSRATLCSFDSSQEYPDATVRRLVPPTFCWRQFSLPSCVASMAKLRVACQYTILAVPLVSRQSSQFFWIQESSLPLFPLGVPLTGKPVTPSPYPICIGLQNAVPAVPSMYSTRQTKAT